MKISRVRINQWRNFSGVELNIPTDSPMVCLVGENGTGKSNLLELVASLAAAVGISPGIELNRGDPMNEPHDFEFTVSAGSSLISLFQSDEIQTWIGQRKIKWDGKLTIQSQRGSEGRATTQISAGGCDPEFSVILSAQLKHVIKARKSTHHLYLDADRSYPPISIDHNQWSQALGRDWETPNWKRDRAFRPTRTLYTEWIEYCIATETQQGTRHLQEERRALASTTKRPDFIDHFTSFRESLSKVLPHLKFEGVDTVKRTLNFDTSGVPLKFSQLSGGEREIAFLIGQIERFQLREGLLLVDEPELHLNPDLIRIWIAFLRDTVTDGQVWIATHSLEAVEVAGRACSFVLQRTSGTRLVEKVGSLQDRPMLAALTAALGSPGFSISRRRFLFIEGERGLGERERFHRLLGDPDTNRFMEAGGCRDVVRKVATVREMAAEADETIRVGGIIDRDFRGPKELQTLRQTDGIIVLACHEIENFFLHPSTLDSIAGDNGVLLSALSIIQFAADKLAGGWIQQHACAQLLNTFDPPPALKKVAWNYDWQQIEIDRKAFIGTLVAMFLGMPPDDAAQLKLELEKSMAKYETQRTSSDLWKTCMGKQAMAHVAFKVGLAGSDFLEQAVASKWSRGTIPVPKELEELRTMIAAI